MTIETRIAALKTALAEKYAVDLLKTDIPGAIRSEVEAFTAGASALAEVYRAIAKVELLETFLEDPCFCEIDRGWLEQSLVKQLKNLQGLISEMEEKV